MEGFQDMKIDQCYCCSIQETLARVCFHIAMYISKDRSVPHKVHSLYFSLTGNSKLPVDVNLSINGCLSDSCDELSTCPWCALPLAQVRLQPPTTLQRISGDG